MNNKEKLRQQLLEQTFGKNAKNRRLSSYNVSQDLQQISSGLEDILKHQQESIQELSQPLSDEDIEKLNKEIEKDFGVTFVSHEKKINVNLLDNKEEELQKKWHYDEMIHQLISAMKKSILMDKKEYSFLFYHVKGHDLKNIIKDYAMHVYQQDISYLSFIDYTGQIDIFYQDIYRCLYGEQQLIVIDYLELLPISLVQPLLSLLKNKEMTLTKRYVEVSGILKETNNQLVKDAISSLKWEDKYIVFLSHVSLNDLTDRFGSPFIKAIDECIAYQTLNQEHYQSVLSNKISSWKERVEKQLSVELKDEAIHQYFMDEKIAFDEVDLALEKLFEYIIDIKNEYQISVFEFVYQEHQLYFKNKDQNMKLFKEDHQEFIDIDQQLQELVGLQEVKEYLQSLKQYYATVQKRRQQGKKVMEVSKHMIFTGNPGTGKTTVARILAQYLKSAGILKSGHLIEVSRKDLVGQYVGHTAVQTSQVIASALGGVLFIDEAYSLYRGKDDSFGLEAIDTLVKAMEDKRDEFVVVLAGYQKEMEQFLESNSGLRSRFSNIIEFKDYTGEELYHIACAIAKGKEYIIDDSCKETLVAYLTLKNQMEGGNGRLARNVVEKAMIHQATRGAENDLLILEDFELEGSESD